MSENLSIESLGAKGDGIATGPVFVPFTLPGERVEVERSGPRARLISLIQPSLERRVPPCPHFGVCGGCDLQHASPDLYRAFKRDLVVEAFRRVGIETEIGDLVACPPASRRRAVFSASRAGGQVPLGFHEAMSHRIVPIEICLVVLPEIARALPVLRRLAAMLVEAKRELRMTVTLTASGLDVAVEDAARLTDALRKNAITFALASDLARLSVGGEIVVQARQPTIAIGRIVVAPPPGAFLQAVAGAEAEMARRVQDHLAGSKTVADLFCGIGTFALRLAADHSVHAVENEPLTLTALDQARRGVPGLKPITTERRDLVRRPLTAKELSRFDGVVFDPPRAGAEAQAQELARSKVKRVVAVSCNPVTLARDAKILFDGGYRLVSVTPIDQFVWSHHVEAVALFQR